ncbi:SGNH/GDSL hydrolase family protein [Saccharothrix violaceirubra]|uniref:SGNH hydrolase-type esterase domain-containing protein n=1 Tax=Saccharothrix violaceirubra TaxID=413306 RepID=A0A7W7T5P0_9PSEU|nr:SGNH/GDSL hydrolase family protein [Saccharothrix violaceirubra]MBB4967058.1 hypothetical protein [Saccharothrix violaceirubra]
MTRIHAARAVALGTATALATALGIVPSAGAQPTAKAEYQWVALGDSYTAGVIPASGDTFEVPRDGCERTDRSYPQVIDRDLGALFELTNVSCGAATIEDVSFRAQQPIGRHLPPLVEDPDYPFPPVPPQSEAAGSDTDVITVGVGGNTLGFAELLLQCLRLGGDAGGVGTPCRDAQSDGIRARLDKVGSDYEELLRVLHERAPKAKILAVGYPTVIPGNAADCEYNNFEQFGSVTPEDLDWLRKDVLEPLNAVIKAAAETHDATVFVDLYESSRDHSVCAATKWVDGIFTQVPDQMAFVHPNAQGHRNAADHVTEALLNTIS